MKPIGDTPIGFKNLSMKKILLFSFLLLTQNMYAQDKASNVYLLVRIESYFDNTTQKDAYIINAESGCDSASNIYSLKRYDFKKNAINTDGNFYYKQKNGLLNFYNYFLSPTEAIIFLSGQGWTLLSIYTEAFSGYDNQRSGNGEIVPITTISSRPVFCFKK